ncbi:hypothetical protein [Streptomyces sp. NPDC087856]|uniref:hypothetical protein n=1 Tax=Streptomyces sp. NPDC087856 TaxID=3365811 RepID=UPI0037FE744E
MRKENRPGRGTKARRAGALLAATALTVGVAVATAPSAAAASPCWSGDANKWWCNNVSGAPVYGTVGDNHLYPDPNVVVGYMYSNPSWFYCKEDNQAWVGGPHSTRWEMTVADNGRLGFMKDTAIASETNPLPNCFG